MASIRKEGKNWYAIFWVNELQKQKWVKLPADITTKRQAKKVATEMEVSIKRKILGIESCDVCEKTFLELAADELAEIRVTNGKDWYSACNNFVKRFFSYVGDPLLTDVTTDQCRKYQIRRLNEGANRSTLHQEISFLKRLFNQAVKNDHIKQNPWNGIKIVAELKHDPRFISQDDFQRLLDVAPEHRRFRYLFLAYTGARKGEAQKARWEHVNFQQKIIKVTNSNKGGIPKYAYRTVPIPDELYRELEARQSDPKKFIFPCRNNWLRDLKVDIKNAEIAVLRIHDLRHCYGSWLAQNGVNLLRIRDLMGHSDVATTQIYAHLIPDDFSEVHAAFNKMKNNIIDINKLA